MSGFNGELPDGWRWSTLGAEFKWGSGGTPKSTVSAYYDGGIPWAVIGDLNDGVVRATARTISEEGLRNSSAKWIDEGAILVAMYGSIGKLGIAGSALTTNQAIAFTKPETVNPRYLFWYLRSIRSELTSLGKGGTQSNISQTVIKSITFPVAPCAVQDRIVEEIETQFARLDDAVASLQRARARLKRYRASVTEAAVSGPLHSGSVSDVSDPDSEDVLDVSQYLSDIASRYQRALPAGWKVVTLQDLAEPKKGAITDGPFGSNLKSSHYTEHGPRVIRLQNIGDNKFRDEQAHISQEHFEFLRKHAVETGDIVCAILGDPLPRSCLIPPGVSPAIVKADCIRIRIDQDKANSAFVNLVLNSQSARHLADALVHGVGRPRISLRATGNRDHLSRRVVGRPDQR